MVRQIDLGPVSRTRSVALQVLAGPDGVEIRAVRINELNPCADRGQLGSVSVPMAHVGQLVKALTAALDG